MSPARGRGGGPTPGSGTPRGRWPPLLGALIAAQAVAVGAVLSGSVVAGGRGSGPTQLFDAAGVAVAANGDVVLCDTNNHRVQRCPASGGACTTIAGGSAGAGSAQLRGPYAAALLASGDSDVLFVADTGNARVMRWLPGARAGVLFVGGQGELDFPSGLAMDKARSHLYVADTGQHRIRRYRYDSSGTLVANSGTTVAGVTGEAAEPDDVTRLNNPMGLFFDPVESEIWVADARTGRLLRWPQGSAEGSAGVVEVSAGVGRPYGVGLVDGYLYYSDYDNCVVWKRLPDRSATVAVAGNFGCGAGLQQLQSPVGIVAMPDGTLFVADSGNSRVLRYGPWPAAAAAAECRLSRSCVVELQDGNPAPGHLLTAVSLESGGCGQACVPAAVGGGTWSPVARATPPFKRTGAHDFGAPRLGEATTYRLCFGSAVSNVEALRVAEGDCRAVDRDVGTVTFVPYIDFDWLGSRPTSQCVQNAPCKLTFRGYAIPNGTTIMSPPGSGLGTNYRCADTTGDKFSGYRDFLLTNPGATPNVYWLDPEADLSTTTELDFGVALGRGTQQLCLCYGGTACNQPAKFKIDAGRIRIRAVLPAGSFTCRLGEACTLRARGKWLLPTDVIAAAPLNVECSAIDLAGLRGTMPFATPVAAATDAVQDAVNGTEEDYIATFELGMATADGPFKLCYCASYDGPDADLEACGRGEEFTQEAGSLEVMRVAAGQSFECAATQPCSVEVRGYKLQKTDTALVTMAELTACGAVAPFRIDATSGNSFLPVGAAAGDLEAVSLELGAYGTPGRYALCYCSTQDLDGDGPCNGEREFYQEAASLVIRGPTPRTAQCVQGRDCTVQVAGFRLSAGDRLQVCPLSGAVACGGTECAAVGPDAGGMLAPLSARAEATTFNVGVLPVGSYQLCYCASGASENLTSWLDCGPVAAATMPAGTVVVRGVDADQLFTCVDRASCAITVQGFNVRSTDQLMIVQLDGVCGAAAAASGAFFPTVLRARSADASKASFQVDMVLSPNGGRFRVCYCSLDSCAGPADYSLDAGPLFVVGVAERPSQMETTCTLGHDCAADLAGVGFRAGTDRVLLVPRHLGCAGEYMQVSGEFSPNHTLNGAYRRLATLSEGRPQYLGVDHQRILYYNTYWSRWLMGPRKDPDVPEEEGFAWVGGLAAETPERFTDLPWKVWDPDGGDGGGAWLDWPALRVSGSILRPGVFETNPSNTTSREVPDALLGPPYELAKRFHLGLASEIGSYRLCFCASTDLKDNDQEPCSAEEEYLTDTGFLVVTSLVGGQRFHCLQDGACEVRVAMLDGIPDDGPARLVIVPGGQRCHEANQGLAGWAASRNVSGSREGFEVVFDLGKAVTVGEFELCLCTNYDDGLDGQPCSALEEFFQRAGSLTVAPLLRLEFTSGDATVLTLVRGSGLHADDRLELVPADNCSAAAGSGGLIAEPLNVSDSGAWATFDFGERIARGTYAVCLCPAYDGLDGGSAACDSGEEFRALVGRVTVSVLPAPAMVTSVDSTLKLTLRPNKTAGRRLATAADPLNEIFGVDTFEFMSIIQVALLGAANGMLGLAPGATRLHVKDVTTYTAREAADLGATIVRTDFRLELEAEPELQVLSTCLIPTVLNYLSLPSTVQAEAMPPTTYEYRVCLKLPNLIDQAARSFQSRVEGTFLREVAARGLPVSLKVPEGLFVSPATTVGAGRRPLELECVQDAQCTATLTSPAASLDGGALLVAQGSALCGSPSVEVGDTVAVDRAADGFVGALNPARVPLTGNYATKLAFDLGRPRHVGRFTLCYCMLDPADCILDKHFDQQAGTLTVRGLTSPRPADCIAFGECSLEVTGVGLGYWDRIQAVAETDRCGRASSEREPSLSGNPGRLPRTSSLDQADSFRSYTLGVPTQVGIYRLCYCPAYDAALGTARPAASLPCQSSADFPAPADLLYVRGIDRADFNFSTVRADDAIAPEAFVLEGMGLLPGSDKVLLIPSSAGLGCGQYAEATQDVVPNPAVIEPPPENLSAWGLGEGSSRAILPVAQATRTGTYRVCFCTEAAGLRSCDVLTNFVHQAGTLEVKGAVGGQRWICRAGFECTVKIQGFGLGLADRVNVLPASQRCGGGAVGALYTAASPAWAADVDEEGAVVFHVGSVPKSKEPFSLNVCYCAEHNADKEGEPCTEAADFSHSAGVINAVLCPAAPEVQEFVPSVEDIHGIRGQPHLDLWLVEERACESRIERSSSTLKDFSHKVPSNGRFVANLSMVVTSADMRCNASVPAPAARLNDLLFASTIFEVLAPPGHERRLPFELRRGYGLRASPAVTDVQLNEYRCPAWEVYFVSFACDWTGAAFFGLALHLVMLLAAAVLAMNRSMEGLGQLVQRLRRSAAAAEALTEGGAAAKDRRREAEAAKQRAREERAVRRLEGTWFRRIEKYVSPWSPVIANTRAWASLGQAFSDAPAAAPAAGGEQDAAAVGALALPLLRGAGLTVSLAFVRVLVFAGHGLCLYFTRAEDLDTFMLLVVPGCCIFLASSIQLVVVAAFGGIRGLVKASGMYMAMFYSLVAVGKLHLDLSLPLLLRKHHCELWPVAAVLFGAAAFVQLVLPLWSLLLFMLPARRALPRWAGQAALRALELAEERQRLPPAPRLAATAAQAATQASPLKPGAGGALAGSAASEMQHAQTEARVRQRWADDAGEDSDVLDEEEEGGSCFSRCFSRWRYTTTSAKLRAKWSSATLSAKFQRCPPEALQRRRLLGLYQFMDAAGWHLGTALTRDVVERSTGLEVDPLEARMAALMICAGGLDLAALHFFALAWYFARLSNLEFFMLLTAFFVGVMQAARPGVGAALFSAAARWAWRPSHGAALWLAALLWRLAMSAPLCWGCPDVTYVFTLAFVSTLFVEAPLYALAYPFLHPEKFGGRRPLPRFTGLCRRVCCCCRRRRTAVSVAAIANGAEDKASPKKALAVRGPRLPSDVAAELPPASVLKFQGSEPLVTALFRLIETLSEDVRPELLGEKDSGLRRVQQAVQRLYALPAPLLGLAGRRARLLDAGRALRQVAERIRLQSRPCRMAFDQLRELADEELRYAQLAVRAGALANAPSYRLATLGSRAQLLAAVLPSAPKIWLVHWRTLDTIKRLPDAGEKECLVTATAAFEQHGHRAVLIPVAHRWRTKESADPHGATCRQLVTFAHWYRGRWGEQLEPLFWIDACCLPELAGEVASAEETVLRGQSVGTLSAVALRGLRTLPCWIEENGADGGGTEHSGTEKPAASIGDTFDEPVTQAGVDAFLPLLFAAADAVVVCESRGFEACAWVRAAIALARAFAPGGKLIYSVDRHLVHVPREVRRPLAPDEPPLVATATATASGGGSPLRAGASPHPGAGETLDGFLSTKGSGWGAPGSGFHWTLGSTGASWFRDQAEVAARLAASARSSLERWQVLDPTDWANVELFAPEQHRSRLARLAAMCSDRPTAFCESGFRREPLVFGSSEAHVCRRQRRPGRAAESAEVEPGGLQQRVLRRGRG